MVGMVEGGDNRNAASCYKPKLNFHFLDHFLIPNELEFPFARSDANYINAAS